VEKVDTVDHKTELDEYQDWVKETTYGNMKGVELLIMSNAFGGEAGELMNVVKKIYRDHDGVVTDDKLDDLRSEIGDNIWYLAGICNAVGLRLDEVIEENIQKINARRYGLTTSSSTEEVRRGKAA
jgi:NTP pyrophosphatase (non-canonical NTP hydrolase)